MSQIARTFLFALIGAISLTGSLVLADGKAATKGATEGKSGIPDAPSTAALEFVGQFSDQHLTGMLQRIGARQPTMVALSQLHGQMLAAVYDAEIAKAVLVHGPEWQKNMARAWTGLMTDDELTSLIADGATSPHTGKHQEMTPQAGQRMQTLSGELFRGVLADVIQNTVTTLGGNTDGEADGEKTEARDDGTAKEKSE